MKFLSSIFLMIGGLSGTVICFLSDIISNSSLALIDGLDLSVWLGLFFVVAFFTGLYNMFLTN
jgi:hypothetical protein